MYIDAHCHPFNCLEYMSKDEIETRGNIAIAASSWNPEQFEYHKSLAENAATKGNAPVVLCFAVHPQFPSYSAKENTDKSPYYIDDVLLPFMENLAEKKQLHAIGETGFDLFNDEYRNTEKIQDDIFAHHLEIALEYGLPMVLHVRRAMHKIFLHAKKLKELPAVVFHSWSGTAAEAESMLRHGVNAFFSFGAVIVNNHKQAQACCAMLPSERLLFETDAPYQPPRSKTFSSWADLSLIYKTAADLRGVNVADLENIAADNFARAFGAKLAK